MSEIPIESIFNDFIGVTPVRVFKGTPSKVFHNTVTWDVSLPEDSIEKIMKLGRERLYVSVSEFLIENRKFQYAVVYRDVENRQLYSRTTKDITFECTVYKVDTSHWEVPK